MTAAKPKKSGDTSPGALLLGAMPNARQGIARTGHPLRPGLGLAVICAASFLVGMDGLAVAIALPAIQADLELTPVDSQWILTAFGLCFGGLLLLGGRLGDLYGRRRVMVIGLLLFAAGSVLAGAAPTPLLVFAGRAVQGIGAALATPATLSLIGSLYPPGPTRSRALGVMAAAASLGIISGALFGGVVTTVFGWRWVFSAAAPLAAAAAVIAPFALPEARADDFGSRRSPDLAGAVLVTTGMMLVLYGMSRVEHHGPLSIGVLAPAIVGIGLLIAFVVWERRTTAPLVRLGILRLKSVRGASLGIGFNAAAFTCVIYVGTLYLQSVLDYTPLEAGLALLPVDVASAVVGIGVGRVLLRRSPRLVTMLSFGLTCAGLLWLARTPVPARYLLELFPPLVLLGISLTIVFVVLTHEVVSDVHDDEKGLASGIFETANHLIGGAVAVAIYATVAATAANPSGASVQAMTAGYRAAFVAGATLAVLGTLTATQLRGNHRISRRRVRHR